jgi:pilus assembly protein CpaE
MANGEGAGRALTALVISPDRELAAGFARSQEASRAFQVFSDLKAYPPQHVLETRLRQLRPDVVLLDLATDLDRACELIRYAARILPEVQVVGLHVRNDPDAILRSLRMGASEFLYAPFHEEAQGEAVSRILRLRRPEPAPDPGPGKVLLFSSAKPGSGASTLAAQTASALQGLTARRVLLADLDLAGGSAAFCLGIPPNGGMLEALAGTQRDLNLTWPDLIRQSHGLDVLSAPELPATSPVEPSCLHALLEHARRTYDWIVLDAPAVFQRTSLLALSESDSAFLVTTSELPSLHVARKAVALLGLLGFARDRFQVVVNRAGKTDEWRASDMQKIFGCPVSSSFPEDGAALGRAVALGRPLDGGAVLGRAVGEFARRLAGLPPDENGRSRECTPAHADTSSPLAFARAASRV